MKLIMDSMLESGVQILIGVMQDDAGVLTDYGSGNEFDVYLGYATEVNSIGVDLGYVSFKYPGIILMTLKK